MALLGIPGFLPEFALQALAAGTAGGGAAFTPHRGVYRLQACLLIEVAIDGMAG